MKMRVKLFSLVLLSCLSAAAWAQSAKRLQTFRGETMATTREATTRFP